MPVGIFRNISDDTIRQFVFRANDSIVSYYFSSCYSNPIIQSGTYSLIGNRLVVNAMRPICEVGEEQYSDLVIGSYKKDSSLLEIVFFDNQQGEVTNVSLVGKGSKSGKLYGSAASNGYLNMTIANVDIPIKLTTGFVGYKNYQMIIDTIGIHRIKCPLVPTSNSEEYENLTKLVFIIKSHNQQEIVAKERNDKKFRVYRLTNKPLPRKVLVD